MAMLRDLLLSQSRLKPSERAHLERALNFAWCWPAAPELDKAARASCEAPPAGAELGQVCLVSVSPTSQRSALWVLGPDLATHPHSVPLDTRASGALDVAHAVAARDLPLLGDPSSLGPRHRWGALCITRDGDGVDHVLDGSSYGLAMCLAIASLFLRQPVPADLVASAVVHRDGSLGPVGGLERKVEIIAGSALGARRLFVFEEQVGKVEALLDALGAPAIEVIGVRWLAEAFTRVFQLDELLSHEERLWPTVDTAARAARVFFRAALESKPVLLDWRGFAKAADALCRRLAAMDDEDTHAALRDVAFARDVARRHAGEQALLTWPSDELLASLVRQRRLELLAHVVQSAADASDDASKQYAERAVAHLAAPSERHEADLKLLGAIGRARAAFGDYERAATHLREALDGWAALGREDLSSHALSEYLRVLGVIGRSDELERARQTHVAELERHASTEHASRAFVRLALGRALHQAGESVAACEVLASDGDVDWALTPDHVKLSRLRWWALALARCGRAAEAERARSELEASAAVGRPSADAVLLARIDVALERGQDPAPAVEELLRHPIDGREARRLLARLRPGVPAEAAARDAAAARELAEHYRY